MAAAFLTATAAASARLLCSLAAFRLRLETAVDTARAGFFVTFSGKLAVAGAFFAAGFGGGAFLLTADCFLAAGAAFFFVLFLAAFGAALRLAGTLFAAAFGTFFLAGALGEPVAFEAARFLPAGFVLLEDAFFFEAGTAFAFLALLAPELTALAAFFFVRCDIQMPLC